MPVVSQARATDHHTIMSTSSPTNSDSTPMSEVPSLSARSRQTGISTLMSNRSKSTLPSRERVSAAIALVRARQAASASGKSGDGHDEQPNVTRRGMPGHTQGDDYSLASTLTSSSASSRMAANIARSGNGNIRGRYKINLPGGVYAPSATNNGRSPLVPKVQSSSKTAARSDPPLSAGTRKSGASPRHHVDKRQESAQGGGSFIQTVFASRSEITTTSSLPSVPSMGDEQENEPDSSGSFQQSYTPATTRNPQPMGKTSFVAPSAPHIPSMPSAPSGSMDSDSDSEAGSSAVNVDTATLQNVSKFLDNLQKTGQQQPAPKSAVQKNLTSKGTMDSNDDPNDGVNPKTLAEIGAFIDAVAKTGAPAVEESSSEASEDDSVDIDIQVPAETQQGILAFLESLEKKKSTPKGASGLSLKTDAPASFVLPTNSLMASTPRSSTKETQIYERLTPAADGEAKDPPAYDPFKAAGKADPPSSPDAVALPEAMREEEESKVALSYSTESLESGPISNNEIAAEIANREEEKKEEKEPIDLTMSATNSDDMDSLFQKDSEASEEETDYTAFEEDEEPSRRIFAPIKDEEEDGFGQAIGNGGTLSPVLECRTDEEDIMKADTQSSDNLSVVDVDTEKVNEKNSFEDTAAKEIIVLHSGSDEGRQNIQSDSGNGGVLSAVLECQTDEEGIIKMDTRSSDNASVVDAETEQENEKNNFEDTAAQAIIVLHSGSDEGRHNIQSDSVHKEKVDSRSSDEESVNQEKLESNSNDDREQANASFDERLDDKEIIIVNSDPEESSQGIQSEPADQGISQEHTSEINKETRDSSDMHLEEQASKDSDCDDVNVKPPQQAGHDIADDDEPFEEDSQTMRHVQKSSNPPDTSSQGDEEEENPDEPFEEDSQAMGVQDSSNPSTSIQEEEEEDPTQGSSDDNDETSENDSNQHEGGLIQDYKNKESELETLGDLMSDNSGFSKEDEPESADDIPYELKNMASAETVKRGGVPGTKKARTEADPKDKAFVFGQTTRLGQDQDSFDEPEPESKMAEESTAPIERNALEALEAVIAQAEKFRDARSLLDDDEWSEAVSSKQEPLTPRHESHIVEHLDEEELVAEWVKKSLDEGDVEEIQQGLPRSEMPLATLRKKIEKGVHHVAKPDPEEGDKSFMDQFASLDVEPSPAEATKAKEIQAPVRSASPKRGSRPSSPTKGTSAPQSPRSIGKFLFNAKAPDGASEEQKEYLNHFKKLIANVVKGEKPSVVEAARIRQAALRAKLPLEVVDKFLDNAEGQQPSILELPSQSSGDWSGGSKFGEIEDLDEDEAISAFLYRFSALATGGHLPNANRAGLGEFGLVDSSSQEAVEVDVEVGYVNRNLDPEQQEQPEADEDDAWWKQASSQEKDPPSNKSQNNQRGSADQSESEIEAVDVTEVDEEVMFGPSKAGRLGELAKAKLEVVATKKKKDLTVKTNGPLDALGSAFIFESSEDTGVWLRKSAMAGYGKGWDKHKRWLSPKSSAALIKPKPIDGVATAENLGKFLYGKKMLPLTRPWKQTYKERTKAHEGYFTVDIYSVYEASAIECTPHELDYTPWEHRGVLQNFLHEPSIGFSRNWFGIATRIRGNDKYKPPVCRPKSMEMPIENIPDPGEWTEEWFTTWKAPHGKRNILESHSSSDSEGSTTRNSTVNSKSIDSGGSSVSASSGEGESSSDDDDEDDDGEDSFWEEAPECGTIVNVRQKIGERVTRVHPDYTSALRRSRWRKKYFPKGTFPY